ncbi:MAG: M56 family metallopeptidase [Candidatus Omnitrophica bacterium]|nr:M56 family metallopeptidase [Candidatus Omnitrophota bacterium]
MSGIEWLNVVSEKWAVYLAHCVIDSMVICLLVGLLWYAIRPRASAKFGYFVFVILLLKVIIPGQYSATTYIMGFLSEFRSTPSQSIPMDADKMAGFFGPGKSGFGDQGEGPTPAVSSTQPMLPPLSILSWLMAAWLMIVCAGIIRLAWIFRCTHWFIRYTEPLDQKSFPIHLENLQRISNIKRPVRWVTAPWVKSPAAMGWFRPVIALPKDMDKTLTPNQIQWILLHELSHITWYDSIVLLLQKIVLVLFFFHPAVWWICWNIDQLREYACDDDALAKTDASLSDCGEGFLSVAKQSNGFPALVPAALGIIDYKTMIRKRLMRILDNQRKVRSELSFSAMAVLVAMMVIAIPFSGRLSFAQEAFWRKLDIDQSQRPAPREHAKMVYDSKRDVMILHGGVQRNASNQEVTSSETWEFDGQTWKLVSDEGPDRWYFGLAYDESTGKTVLYGGFAVRDGNWQAELYDDTWEWDGANWTRVEEHSGDPASGLALVYYPPLQIVLRIGGFWVKNYKWEKGYPNTYEWDGQYWIQFAQGGPTGICNAFYDEKSDRILVLQTDLVTVGTGVGDFDNYLHLWEFDGFQWTQTHQGVEKDMVFKSVGLNPITSELVSFGGILFRESLKSNLFRKWTGGRWEEIVTDVKPGARSASAMAYDSKRSRFILFGGSDTQFLNDTWELQIGGASGVSNQLWTLY